MLKEHVKVLAMLKDAGEIVGRKKLQKMVYISKKFKYDFQERFNFHFFGPYSEELSVRIEELVNAGLVEEVKENKGGYIQYVYQLTQQGKEFLGFYPLEWENYQAFTQALNQESSRFLELVSTVLYFEHLHFEELVDKIHKVKSKQNYTVEEIEKALAYIEQLAQIPEVH